MSETATEERPQLRLAAPSDRLLAFLADLLPFVLLYWGLLRLFSARRPWYLYLRAEAPLAVLVVILYALNQALRRGNTRGARLAGLRVCAPTGERLGFFRALLRAAMLPVSAVTLVGGAWALGDAEHRTWHDLVGGSVVVDENPSRRWAGVAWGLASVLLLLGFAWWRTSIPAWRGVVLVEAAQVGLGEISRLERAYHGRYGAYATTIEQLAPLSEKPDEFLADMRKLYAPEGKVKISVWNAGYDITAPARDRKRTIVELNGP